jgi:hypothetical protein
VLFIFDLHALFIVHSLVFKYLQLEFKINNYYLSIIYYVNELPVFISQLLITKAIYITHVFQFTLFIYFYLSWNENSFVSSYNLINENNFVSLYNLINENNFVSLYNLISENGFVSLYNLISENGFVSLYNLTHGWSKMLKPNAVLILSKFWLTTEGGGSSELWKCMVLVIL